MTLNELYKMNISWDKEKKISFINTLNRGEALELFIGEGLELFGNYEVMFFGEQSVAIKGGK